MASAASVVARYKAAVGNLQVGKWYRQGYSSSAKVDYFVAKAVQKNGGWSGILVSDNEASRAAPKAKKDSVSKLNARLWTEIPEAEVPDKVKDAANNK